MSCFLAIIFSLMEITRANMLDIFLRGRLLSFFRQEGISFYKFLACCFRSNASGESKQRRPPDQRHRAGSQAASKRRERCTAFRVPERWQDVGDRRARASTPTVCDQAMSRVLLARAILIPLISIVSQKSDGDPALDRVAAFRNRKPKRSGWVVSGLLGRGVEGRDRGSVSQFISCAPVVERWP